MDYNDDIVDRLRLYAERQKQTRSTVLGLLLSDSADEIERLREERDEARREVCRDEAYRPSPSPPCTANQVADRRGWDCFKENTNG